VASLDNLYVIWEAQIEHFGGFGLPIQNYEGSSGGYGLATPKYNEKPLFSSRKGDGLPASAWEN